MNILTNVISWCLVVLAIFLICVGKFPDYVVACVFMLMALFLRLSGMGRTLCEILEFHRWAHGDAMKGVVELKTDFAPMRTAPGKEEPFKGTLWHGEADPRESSPHAVKDGDVWIPPHKGRKYLLVKGEWLPEDCAPCCWCFKPISPLAEKLNYPDGKVAHLRCPTASVWKLCDHCQKPYINCDCSDDSGFARHREWGRRHGK